MALSTLAVTVVVGRLLGPQGLGEWALLVAAGTFVHTTFVNWTHASTVRFGCAEWIAGGTMRRTVSARLPLVLASTVVALMVLLFQPLDWLRLFGIERAAVWLVAAYAASLWLTAEAQAALQALEAFHQQTVVGTIAGLGSLGAVWLVGVFQHGNLSGIVLAIAATNGIVWGMTWAATLVRARVRLGRPTLDELRQQVRYGGPLLIAFTIGYVGTWGGHLLLRTFTTVEQVGYFGLSYQVFASIVAANGMLSTVLFPRLVANQVRSALVERRYVEESVPTLFVLWGMGMTAIVSVLPVVAILISGEQFRPAATPLIVLCAAIPGSVITSLYTSLFSLQQRHSRVLLYTCLTVSLNLAISALLIPRFGAVGAAVGVVASYAAAQIAYLVDQHRHLAISATRLALVWGAVVFFGIGQMALGAHVGWRLIWGAIAVVAIGWIARRTAAVDARLVNRLFIGLSPIGGMLCRALVVPSRAPLQPRPANEHHAGTF
jgi:O-antigen/teichoic acid export membrane protein